MVKSSIRASALAAGGLASPTITAEPFKVLALQSPQLVLNEIAAEFERRTGHRIVEMASLSDMPVHIRDRIAKGDDFDAVFLVPPILDELAEKGLIVTESRARFLRVPVGLAVRVGAPRPDISTVDAFKQTVINAKSVAFLKAGISGRHLQGIFERFGLARNIEAKALRPETDTVGELVAEGKAEIGITAISTLMATAGVEVVGPIPKDLQTYVSFEGAIMSNTPRPEIARMLLEFIADPSVVNVIREKGMEPWW